MRLSTVAIIGSAVAVVGFGAYKLGHGVDTPASELATVVVSDPQQAAVATAESNLSGAEAAATTYQSDHSGFSGMTAGLLRAYDAGLSGDVVVQSATASSYCIESTVDGTTVSIRGPNGAFVVGAC